MKYWFNKLEEKNENMDDVYQKIKNDLNEKFIGIEKINIIK